MGKDQGLIDGARNGDFHIVEKILVQKSKRSGPLASLRRGAGVNVQDSNGFSALHHAAANRHKEIVELLLSHEASTNLVDVQGSSPLHLAAWSGEEEIVCLVLTHGPSTPNVNLMNQSLDTPLHMSAQFGYVEVVKLLLEHGANPGITNARQETCLDLAAQYGRLETVQLLVNTHPELMSPFSSSRSFTRNVFPHTPLHLASRNGHRNVVEVLINAGFHVNIRTENGTALHEAALCGKVDVVKALLDAGIDVCVTDSHKRTAVDRLSEVGLKTPVAKEIADLIRGALKKSNSSTGICKSGSGTNHAFRDIADTSLATKESKLRSNQAYEDHSSHKADISASETSSCSPNASPKSSNSFCRDKIRRSLDVYVTKGPEKPPKKPPRRNLSASPTHPDLCNIENYDTDTMNSLLSRNKSLDERDYIDSWRENTVPSSNSHSPNNNVLEQNDATIIVVKGDNTGRQKISKSSKLQKEQNHCAKSNEKEKDAANNFVSVAHIKLRDSKSDYECDEDIRGADDNTKSDILLAKEMLSQVPKNESSDNVSIRPKPAVPPKPKIPIKPQIAPKPKNIKRQGKSYENVIRTNDNKVVTSNNRQDVSLQRASSETTTNAIDMDDRNWKDFSTLMDSWSIVADQDGINTVTVVSSPIGRWLEKFNMGCYETLLEKNGFDDVEFLGENILDDVSLLEIGMLNAQHRKILVTASSKAKVNWPKSLDSNGLPFSVSKWLEELHLNQYLPNFENNFYVHVERLPRLHCDELLTVLEIKLIGHRRRLLLAAASLQTNNTSTVVIGSSPAKQKESNRTEDNGSIHLREPNDLVSGVSSILKTAWRYAPETLINGSVSYRATYVGSSLVKEFSTTGSIQHAICEIRAQGLKEGSSCAKIGKPNPKVNVYNVKVTLLISATVISWYNAKTNSLVNEQEVGTIQCTCQASDDLRHLALVTKDQHSTSHSCHVFGLDSVEIATEAILTLGQAFEVAYQLALCERKEENSFRRHVRSKSANQLSTSNTLPLEYSSYKPFPSITSSSDDNDENYYCSSNHKQIQQHYRSHSITEFSNTTSFSVHSSNPINDINKSNNSYTGIPRAESFSFPSQYNHKSIQIYSKAPIVSKDEL